MTQDEVFDCIVICVNEVLPSTYNKKLQVNDNLEILGANSVERSEIIMASLEKLDLNISLVETYGPKNLGELAELLHGKLA